MPQHDDSENQSLSFLIKMAFSNYEIAMNKYERLLVDNTTLNVLIKEKLSQLPIESEIRQVLQDLVNAADNRVQHQQDKLDIKENGNKLSTDQLIKDFTAVVKDLIFRLKIVLGWLAIVSVVGVAALGYIKFVTVDIPKQKTMIEHPIDDKAAQPHIDYIDKDGHKIVIPIPIAPEQNHTTGVTNNTSNKIK